MTGKVLSFLIATSVSLSIMAPVASNTANATPLLVAQTQGMDNRQDRRDDRQDNRDDRQDDRQDNRDDRQDCRQEEGVAGQDKRECKQEERQDG